ncbi:hypothetical protein QEH59_09675 [Coraliomargarita sp. SDUM461004]|uniref:Uncharacterized protein n=1 Tax=Thalassobacterium sedimentorum TaxID=3041258 RepID=A0ABU1ALG4_9BACT|nr:hypothetical protein [Coraliomargarita sp. SDUM461004]MDQ8194695.1 hypothetical protein [Coraliomargarita sp. SDUM461004]
MAIVTGAVNFYEQAAPIIKNGHSRFLGPGARGWSNPTAWQGLWRESNDDTEALLFIHTFNKTDSRHLGVNA